MQPGSYDHQVRCPAVHVAPQRAKRPIILQIDDVLQRLALRGVVVVQQQNAGERQDDEQVKRYGSHAPRVAESDRVPVDLCRVQMEEHVGEHSQRTRSRRGLVFDSEYGLVDLSAGGVLELFEFGEDRVLLYFLLEQIKLFTDIFLEALALFPDDCYACLTMHLWFIWLIRFHSSAPDNLRSAGLSCFGDFPYPTPVDPLLPLFDSFPNRVPQGTLDRKIRARVVEVTLLTLRPLKQPAGVHDQLPGRVELHVSAVHRTRRRPFEVYTFVGIPAAV